jgi:NitT/TauT family transport system ATP-binding protein
MTLIVSDITKTYGLGTPSSRLALEPSSLTVAQGEFVSIVGPSGCGKSTLLMMMAGLLDSSAGTVNLDGVVVDGPPRGMAVVFQDYSRSLFPWLTVRRNLSLAGAAYKLGKAELNSRVDRALESVGLHDVDKLYPWQMSGGMQQRVAIARALVMQPKVLLMDEPFAAVDAQTRADLEDLVLRVRDEYGMTIIFVTHDIDEAVYVADRVVVMRADPGRIDQEVIVDLARARDQVATKLQPRFAELRGQIFNLVMRPVPGAAGPAPSEVAPSEPVATTQPVVHVG